MYSGKIAVPPGGGGIVNNIITKTFLFYNTKISDNIAESGKVPRMLAAFPR
jgi:hypothetical protein